MSAVSSLWPPVIHSEALSPFAILESQAMALAEQTKKVLIGEVRESEDKENEIGSVSLDLVAPVLDNYRRRVLTISHTIGLYYPATVGADCFRPNILDAIGGVSPFERKKPRNEASSDEELRQLVQQVLQSSEVVSLAVSLIARSNDVLKRKQNTASKGQNSTESAAPPERGSDDLSELPGDTDGPQG